MALLKIGWRCRRPTFGNSSRFRRDFRVNLIRSRDDTAVPRRLDAVSADARPAFTLNLAQVCAK